MEHAAPQSIPFPAKLSRVAEEPALKIAPSQIRTVPYAVSEDAVRKAFEDFVLADDAPDAPLDIALCALNYTVDRVLCPVRRFQASYSADWTATSVWQHNETSTEYEPETVYFDHLGREHASRGFDVFKDGKFRYTERAESLGGTLLSSAVADEMRPFTPQQRMRPVTRRNTVTDDVRTTGGSIQQQTYSRFFTLADDANQKRFSNWVCKMPVQTIYARSVAAAEYPGNSLVIPLLKSNQSAQNAVAASVESAARKQCKAAVPGDAAESFQMSNLKADYEMEVLMVPLYRVTYQYHEKAFECWFHGLEPGAPLYDAKPQEKPAAPSAQKTDKERAEIAARQKKRKLVAFVSYWTLSMLGMAGCFIFLSVVPMVIMLGAVLIWLLTRKKKEKRQEQELRLEKEAALRAAGEARERAAALARRTDLSAQEKEAGIREIARGATAALKGEA